MIDGLQRYDNWLHSKVMNPTYRWVQAWLHCNRFQLIQFMLIMQGLATVFYVYTISPNKGSPALKYGSILPIIGLLVIRVKRYWAALSQASIEFEEGLESRAIAYLLPNIRMALFGRTFGLNFMATGELIFLPLPAIGVYRLDAWQLGMSALIATWFIEFHLWDADDLPPKDRKRLLRPAELPT